MDDETLHNLLTAHADALNGGEVSLAAFLQANPSLPPEAKPLFTLAWQLKQLFVPVPVPGLFRAQLHDYLTANEDVPVAIRQPSRRRPLWVGAAAVGSLLPLVGLLLFWWHRQRSDALSGAA